MTEKNAQLRVEEKNKKKGMQGTPHCRQPAAKANAQSPTRRVCGSATVPCNQKKASVLRLNKRKQIKKEKIL